MMNSNGGTAQVKNRFLVPKVTFVDEVLYYSYSNIVNSKVCRSNLIIYLCLVAAGGFSLQTRLL